jgi:hypothetical protein
LDIGKATVWLDHIGKVATDRYAAHASSLPKAKRNQLSDSSFIFTTAIHHIQLNGTAGKEKRGRIIAVLLNVF